MKRMLLRATAALCVTAALSPLLALDPGRELTQYVQRIWQAQQGLPDATIVDITQTRQGYLWLATEAGLVRFDGVRFVHAERLLPGAPAGAWMRSVFEDDAGTLWLGTNELGVFALRPEKSTQYTVKDGLPSDLALCVAPGSGGVIWVCTDRGLARIDPKNSTQPVTAFHVADGLPSENIRVACEDNQGRLWVGETATP